MWYIVFALLVGAMSWSIYQWQTQRQTELELLRRELDDLWRQWYDLQVRSIVMRVDDDT